MRIVLSLIILLGVLIMAALASAQPNAGAKAHSQNVGLVHEGRRSKLQRSPSLLRPTL